MGSALTRRLGGLEPALIGQVGVNMGVFREPVEPRNVFAPARDPRPAVSVAMIVDASRGVAMGMGVVVFAGPGLLRAGRRGWLAPSTAR